jgi:hypothetical protein
MFSLRHKKTILEMIVSLKMSKPTLTLTPEILPLTILEDWTRGVY